MYLIPCGLVAPLMPIYLDIERVLLTRKSRLSWMAGYRG